VDYVFPIDEEVLHLYQGADVNQRAIVLIVDSDRKFIDQFSQRLNSEKLQAIGTSAIEEAQALFELHHPETVILDPSIPGAFDFLQHLRNADAPCAVIALTEIEEDRRRLEAVGVEIILSRHSNPSALVTAIRTYVNDAPIIDSNERIRLLVVDDEPDLLRIFHKLFTARGHLVETARDGPGALALLGQRPDINVVLLDIRLPGMGGLEILKQITIRKVHPGIIVMSALGDEQIAKLAITLGAFDYIQKPIDFDQLEGVLSASLSHDAYRNRPLLGRIKGWLTKTR
jgi:DNA-binding response OmpR family regulator